MVLLGGLEIVAAGYLLNEVTKDGKSRDTEDDERRRRRKHRKHEHHDNSPPRHNRPPHLQSPPRPLSAPPPASGPMWNPHQGPGPMTQTSAQPYPLPQQRPYHPQPQWQQSPPAPQYQNTGPPQASRPAQMNHPQTMPAQPPQQRPPTSQPQPHRPGNLGWYPPPGTYIDMKTGKVQHDMLPADVQRQLEANQKSWSNGWAPQEAGVPWQNLVHGNEEASRSQPRLDVPPQAWGPREGYAELDSETPGRYAKYAEHRQRAWSHNGREQTGTPPPPYSERW